MKKEYTQAIAVDAQGQYALLIKRRHNPGKDLLSGVGGTVDEGESPEQCMRREWEEETNIPLDDAQVIHLVTLEDDDCINHMFGIVLPKIDIYYYNPIGEGPVRWHHIIGCDIMNPKNTAVAWDGLIPYCLTLLKKRLGLWQTR